MENGLILPEMNQYGQQVVEIREEKHRTGGHFQAITIEIPVNATKGIYKKDLSWPIPINLLGAKSLIIDDMDCDELSCSFAKDTIIGVITSPVEIEDNIINVSDTVISKIKLGYYINIYNGNSTIDLGRVLKIDEDNKTIEVETPSTKYFKTDPVSYIRMTIKLVPCIKLRKGVFLDLGSSKIGANYIPKGTKISFEYNNVNGKSKIFSCILEYLY